MLQRMNELAVQASNGTNAESDRQAIQDEIDQLTTEIDRVSETTKFNETYLLKGEAGTKLINMKAHDAGLKGTLTDNGDGTATFKMDALSSGDKISIGGKQYTIGSTADEAKNLYKNVAVDGSETVTVNGKTYTVQDTNPKADKNEISKNDLDALVKAGVTVEYKGQSATVITDDGQKGGTATDGVDDLDPSVITAKKAYELASKELLAANQIGDTENSAKVYVGGTTDAVTLANATNEFTINVGQAKVANSLAFSLHVGADADMTNKIQVNIDSMDSASLGIKGLNVKDDSGKAATYAVDAIADAVAKVSSQRSALGAVQNRLEHTIDNLATQGVLSLLQ